MADYEILGPYALAILMGLGLHLYFHLGGHGRSAE